MSDLSDEDEEAITVLLSRYEDKLTEWEREEFLPTLSEQGWMSKRQREIFDELWEEVVVQRKR